MIRRIALAALPALLAVLTAGCNEQGAAPPPTSEVAPIPPPLVDREWRAVIDDWYDNGLFDDRHACVAVRETAERLPRGGPDAVTIHEDLATYTDLVCGDSRRPPAPVSIVHRFVHPLPYPAGVRYTISVRRVGGSRAVRWTRFSSDGPYEGFGSYERSGVTGEATFASALLPPRRYVVSSSTSICADPNDGCQTMTLPQDRCRRTVEVRASARVTVTVDAPSGRPCRISIER